MVNQVNVDKWVEALRDPANKQIGGRLCKVVEEGAAQPLGFCCLGIGAVLAGDGIQIEEFDNEDDDGTPIITVEAYVGHQEDLPSKEFHDWIGDGGGDAEDVSIDWPEGLYEQGTPKEAERYESGRFRPLTAYSCSGLNDACELTFPQIADVIAYFGIKHKDA